MLVAHGLDTVATVTINGKAVLSAANMFQTLVAELPRGLLAQQNAISVAFASPVKEALSQFAACSPESSGQCPDSCPPPCQDGFCQVQYLRKEPCSFSWDWCAPARPHSRRLA